MYFVIASCPECYQAPVYILESMLVHYEIEADADGSFDYTGDSEEFVETAEPVQDAEQRVTVICAAGHEWNTAITESRG